KDEKVDADEPIKQAELPSATAAAAAVAEVLTPVADIQAAVAEAVAAPVVPAAVAAAAPTNAKAESKPKPASREKPAAVEAPKAEKPVAPVPTAPTSWANLAASDSGKWGSNNISKVGGTVAPATATNSAGANAGSDPSSRVSTPASGAREPRRKDVYSVFLKNVSRGVTGQAIKVACKVFGPVVNVDYTPPKTSAIVDFGTDAARQLALTAGTVMIVGSHATIEERRNNRQSSGRRDDGSAGAGKQSGGAASQSGSGSAPVRNSSGEFERVGSSRGSRNRSSNAGGHSGSAQTSAAGQGANRPRAGK
ncbi:hypothetical protein GGI21_006794, partial [Coemansia aciculifera]